MTTTTEMISSQVSHVWMTTSVSASSPNSSEDDESSKIAAYIGVPIAIITILLVAVTIFLLIRRHKRKERRDTDSVAICSGDDILTRNRRPIPGIENQAYFNHFLEGQENDLSSDKTISNSGQYRQTQLSGSTPVLTSTGNYNNVNLKTENIPEDTYEYNKKVISAKDVSTAQYSYVTNGPGGFKIVDDTSYSYITCQNETHHTEKSIKDINTGRICRKSHSTPELKAEKYENISGSFDSSVYDHAVAGGQDPDVKREDISETKEYEKRNTNVRHSYVNVTKENDQRMENNTGLRYDHVEVNGQNPACMERNEYSHLNVVIGNENGIASPGHKYVNVTKGNGDAGALDNQCGDYEEAVGRTPTYFVIEL